MQLLRFADMDLVHILDVVKYFDLWVVSSRVRVDNVQPHVLADATSTRQYLNGRKVIWVSLNKIRSFVVRIITPTTAFGLVVTIII